MPAAPATPDLTLLPSPARGRAGGEGAGAGDGGSPVHTTPPRWSQRKGLEEAFLKGMTRGLRPKEEPW